MDEERGRPRLIWLFVALAVMVAPLVAVVVVSKTSWSGCCGAPIAWGEVWYCREPDAAHPVGELYLLRTSQVDQQVGGQKAWPDRIETGHVGTPLRWRQPAGAVVLAVDLAVVPHTNEVVPDETTASLVREGQVTAVRDTGLGKAGSSCPAPPTVMSTPSP
jgi:hypothetical protein